MQDYDFNSALKRRLAAIQGISDSASYVQSLKNQLNQANNSVPAIYGQSYVGGGQSNVAGDSTFERFINAISAQESGGNYGARNRTSGAMGKYQIMPSNIAGTGRGWDYEILGRDISTQQFMSDPNLQEQIARGKLKQYYDQMGPGGAAIAWYAGPSAGLKYARSGYASKTNQGAYPSINSYMQSILRRFGL